jgi:hypothetical protein
VVVTDGNGCCFLCDLLLLSPTSSEVLEETHICGVIEIELDRKDETGLNEFHENS